MHISKVFPFRLITFDVTNTLLNFKGEIGRTYGDIATRYGVQCDPDRLTKNFKHHFKRMNEAHPNFGRNSGLLWEKWWKTVVCETFNDCQGDLSDKNLNLIYSDLVELYRTSLCWRLAPGGLELLNYLRDRGVALGVISNFDPRLHDILKNVELSHYFEFVLTSYETGVAKPDKRIFERAMIESNQKNLRSDQCLHIGDTYELDYIGARNVGWDSFLVLGNKSKDFENGADSEKKGIFKDLKTLHEFLESKWNNYEVEK